jgi:hypothetical protein
MLQVGRHGRENGRDMGLAISDGSNELRMSALRALESRLPAQLATLVDDSMLTVEGSDSSDAVRTLVFESDHRSEITVRSAGRGELSLRFSTESGGAADIELSQASGSTQTIRSSPAEPAVFDRVHGGPTRLVYSLPSKAGSPRRYQTEWILLP